MSLQLMCVSYGSFDDAAKVMRHCLNVTPVEFEHAVIVHPNPTEKLHGIETVKARSETANACGVHELYENMKCERAIIVHWDGFIVNPKAWDERFLKYDWIGAPWRLENLPNPQWRVGGGGFVMVSKYMARLLPEICNVNENLDWQIGALYRATFEMYGMKYAPLEVALKFSKEMDLDDYPVEEGSTFGFHGFDFGGGYREKYRKAVYAEAIHENLH